MAQSCQLSIWRGKTPVNSCVFVVEHFWDLCECDNCLMCIIILTMSAVIPDSLCCKEDPGFGKQQKIINSLFVSSKLWGNLTNCDMCLTLTMLFILEEAAEPPDPYNRMNFPNRKRRTSAEAWEELRQELMKEKNHIDRRRWNKEADEHYHDGK